MATRAGPEPFQYGWMDGWVDGWVGGWMGGWMGGVMGYTKIMPTQD